MKLSFSLSAKPKKPSSTTTTTTTTAFETSSSKPKTSKQFLTQFDPSEPTTQTLIIPPKPNEYRPSKPSGPNPLQFELETETPGPDPGPDSILYGLNVRQSSITSNGGVASKGDPMLVKYKEDIERLPDVDGFDEFEDMPVEGFGAALLAGYGWKEGMGIGRNAKEDVKIVEYKKWSGKEGLGFDIEAPESRDKKEGKGKDSRKKRRGSEEGDDEVKDGRKRRGGEEDVEEESEEERGRDSSSSRERRGKAKEHVSSSRRSGRDEREEESKGSSRKKRRGREEDVEEESDRDGSNSSKERRDNMRVNSSRRSGRDERDEESKGSSRKKRRGREDVEEQSEDERKGKTREKATSSRRDEESKHSRKKEKKHRRGEDVEKQSEDVRLEAGEVNGRDGSSSRERKGKMRENDSSSRRGDRGRRDEESKHSRKKENKHKRDEDVERQSEVVREGGSEQSRKSEKVIWLFSHTRVRVISKAVKGGQLYLKKGEVVDVNGPSCDILMDEGNELVQGVSQEYLETALPKRGGPVLVLFGKHKGAYGRLMEKDTDKETGVVQDADNHEMLNVRLEQIAEFVGDPSYIGY